MRPALLVALYLIVVLAPLGLAAASDGPPRSFRNELATGLGLLAFTIILVEFVLSGRFRFVSGGVGLDVTMRFHQLLARTALGFAMVHPLLYDWLPGPARPWDPTRAETLTSDFGSLLTGILAFVLLPSFVLLSISRDALHYRYELWRFLHGLGALAIVGLLLHHALYAGRYSADPDIARLWWVLSALAVLSLLVVYLFRPLAQARHPWSVTGVTQISPRQWSLTIEPKGHDGIDYEAGQFVWLNVGHAPFSLYENPFSIASAPSSGQALQFLIKELGDFTATLGRIEPGTRAYVDGPHGTLTVARHHTPGIAMIAGGIGLAPMMGLLREHRLTGDPRPTALIYGNRIEEQIAFRDEIDGFARDIGTRVSYVLSQPGPDWTGATGMIDKALLRRSFSGEELKTWLFVLCGPPAMLEAVEVALVSLGADPVNILSERFKYD